MSDIKSFTYYNDSFVPTDDETARQMMYRRNSQGQEMEMTLNGLQPKTPEKVKEEKPKQKVTRKPGRKAKRAPTNAELVEQSLAPLDTALEEANLNDLKTKGLK